MKTRTLQKLLCLLTAVLVGGICVEYIPARLEQLAVDRLVTEELVAQGEHAVYLGGEAELGVSFKPDSAACRVTWKSDDETVVRVDDAGRMTGAALGTANIVVSTPGGVTIGLPVRVIRKPLPSDSDLPQLYYDVPLVVNSISKPLASDYIPDDLRKIPVSIPTNRAGMQMTADTLEAYTRMEADVRAATGQAIMVVSAYRSYNKQKSLFEEDVAAAMAKGMGRRAAEDYAERTTNRPGRSEHQLGCSVDIGTGPSLSYNFNKTAAGRWVTDHAHEYGFILRYPADKTEKTTIDYEAWHFRYVGTEHARYIYEHSLCLEEYIELLAEAEKAADEQAKKVTATQYVTENRTQPEE